MQDPDSSVFGLPISQIRQYEWAVPDSSESDLQPELDADIHPESLPGAADYWFPIKELDSRCYQLLDVTTALVADSDL